MNEHCWKREWYDKLCGSGNATFTLTGQSETWLQDYFIEHSRKKKNSVGTIVSGISLFESM